MKEGKINLFNILSWYQYMAARFRERAAIFWLAARGSKMGLSCPLGISRVCPAGKKSHDSLKGFALLRRETKTYMSGGKMNVFAT